MPIVPSLHKILEKLSLLIKLRAILYVVRA
jgi:hypothetical protein